MNVDKTGSQSSTMKEPWPEDFDRAFRPPKYQQGCESQFESRFFKACNESPVIPPPTGWEDPETNMIVVKGRLIELDDEVIKDAAETSPPIPDHFLPLKKRSYLQNACPTSRWHSRPLPTWGGAWSSLGFLLSSRQEYSQAFDGLLLGQQEKGLLLSIP